MANLTLRLNSNLLKKARASALEDHSSVEVLVQEYLVRFVQAKAARDVVDALDAIDSLDALATRNFNGMGN